MMNDSNITPNQATSKFKRVDVPKGERKTLAEQMFGYRMEPVEHETHSVLGEKFYGRPVVGKPAKGNS